MDKFSNIKVIIWDFDNTFYKYTPLLYTEMRQAEIKVISKNTGWNIKKAEAEFYKFYKIKYQSATQTVSEITKLAINEVVNQMENYFDRTKYLKNDEKLQKMFSALNNFKHFIFTNGKKDNVIKCLLILGLNKNIFQEIITGQDTGYLKPDKQAFVFLLNKINFPANNCLMVGDREFVDLLPAKKLGMKTCLVWSDKKSEIADITVNSIYSIEKFLL